MTLSTKPIRPRRKDRFGATPELRARVERLREFGRKVRSSEYHLTNACNLRCTGCWFFEYGHDTATSEERDPASWDLFAKREAGRGVTAALLIGGEPTLFPDRVAAFAEAMPFVTVSSNGLRGLSSVDFPEVAVALTLFGGEGPDDVLRAIRPGGGRFSGLFSKVLKNYKQDRRATFVYALDPESPDSVLPTVARIHENGNLVTFNYYSRYGTDDPLRKGKELRLLEEVMRARDEFPSAVLNHPRYLQALLSGRTSWGEFGYESCPSISSELPVHADRVANGNPVLPGFRAVAADQKTIEFCCTSGSCEGCRDSQAVHSWLMVNLRRFLREEGGLEQWVGISESYWSQFVWSPYSPAREISVCDQT